LGGAGTTIAGTAWLLLNLFGWLSHAAVPRYPAPCGTIRGYAVVLMLEPTELSECAPLACRSCRKLVRNVCKADVDCPEAAADPLGTLLSALEALLLAPEALLPVLDALPPVLDALPPVLAVLPALEAPPLRSPINFSNAELRFEIRLDDKPEEDPGLPAVWLRSWISALSSDTMPWRP
jgi:hypothetical protein